MQIKCTVIVLLLLIPCSTYCVGKIWHTPEDIGFEIKNFDTKPITFWLYQTKDKKSVLVENKTIQPQTDIVSKQLNIQDTYSIRIRYNNNQGKPQEKKYQFKPGKTIFIAWQQGKLRPQKGKGICPARISESGFNLSKNVTNGDVREVRN
ncbi:hypothetical protein Noda2021_08960 [Candidatus Dependentiae bacterium Noda2021]|nr:hypothetical protein Noda2021_08960 [Candidatus Dependentiae bacterium Noda2021]